MKIVFLLLVLYQIKHFVCDYPLQGSYMLGKFKPYPQFILPLLAHSLVHGTYTFFIAWCFKSWPVALTLALFDMGMHFTIDRVKASPTLGGRWTALSKNEMQNEILPCLERWNKIGLIPHELVIEHYDVLTRLKSNTYFWWALGADQMAHHLTHYIIILGLIS